MLQRCMSRRAAQGLFQTARWLWHACLRLGGAAHCMCMAGEGCLQELGSSCHALGPAQGCLHLHLPAPATVAQITVLLLLAPGSERCQGLFCNCTQGLQSKTPSPARQGTDSCKPKSEVQRICADSNLTLSSLVAKCRSSALLVIVSTCRVIK